MYEVVVAWPKAQLLCCRTCQSKSDCYAEPYSEIMKPSPHFLRTGHTTASETDSSTEKDATIEFSTDVTPKTVACVSIMRSAAGRRGSCCQQPGAAVSAGQAAAALPSPAVQVQKGGTAGVWDGGRRPHEQQEHRPGGERVSFDQHLSVHDLFLLFPFLHFLCA